MIDDNTSKLVLGIVAVVVILSPILWLFGDKMPSIMRHIESFAESRNVQR